MPWYLLNMKKMKHSLSPLSDPIEVLSFFFRSVSGDVGLEFTLIASGSYHIGSSFNRVTSLIKFQIIKIIELDQNLSFIKIKIENYSSSKMFIFFVQAFDFNRLLNLLYFTELATRILESGRPRADSNHLVQL